MRKSGWAASAGLVSAALLLTACGGGSSNAAGGSSTPTTGAASTNTPSSSGTTPQEKPSSGALTSPPPGTIYFIVQKSKSGYLMAEADSQVVYTYAGDTAGKPSTCTGSCASQWKAIDGVGQVSPADNYPSKFTVIDGQVAYNGLPLYTYAGATSFSSHAGGQWHTIPLSLSEVLGQS
jgi:predicted lipoprotein with Yx(FWY)xxD motif